MNLARTRLMRRLNRTAAEANTNLNPTRELLINDLRELDAAETSEHAVSNDYQRERCETPSRSATNLTASTASLTHPLN